MKTMSNQFQNKLVAAIREFLMAGKPARVGRLGVFYLVHREPSEKMREDGSVILTPPANVVEFMPDPNLRIVDENPILKKLYGDLLYEPEILKKAVTDFARDVYNSSRECSVLVHGLGSFRTINGILTFKATDDLASEANQVYEGLKEIELVKPSFSYTQSNRKDTNSSFLGEEEELISVVKQEPVAKQKSKVYQIGDKNIPIPQPDEPQKFTEPDNSSEEAEINIFEDADDDEIFITKTFPETKNPDNEIPYDFGQPFGFDDGLENFGKASTRSTQKEIKPEDDLVDISSEQIKPASNKKSPGIAFEEDEEINIHKDQTDSFDSSSLFNSLSEENEKESKSDADFSSTFKPLTVDDVDIDDESEDSFKPEKTNKKESLKSTESKSAGENELQSLESFRAEDDDFFFGDGFGVKQDGRNPQELFEEDLKPFSFKIGLHDPDEAEKLRKKALEEEERKRKAEEEAERLRQEAIRRDEEMREAERQRAEQDKARADKNVKDGNDGFAFPVNDGQETSFSLRKKRKVNFNADNSHFDDNIISPVLPEDEENRSDKGLGIAISVAAMILFAIMIYLVYSLFPAEEAEFTPVTRNPVSQEDQEQLADAAGIDRSELNAIDGNEINASAMTPDDGALTYDDVLLELTRQNRGGLFGLYGDYNENISPFYGIVLYSSRFRSEADDMAREYEEREWRTKIIPHDRSDGVRVWRVMVGQFSTVADANVEAKLLPPDMRKEFLVTRYEIPE